MHTIALCCAIFELSCAIYVYLHNRYNREYMTTVKAFIRTGKKDKEVNVRFRLSDGRNVQLFHKSDIWSLLLFGMPRLKNIRLKVL